MSIANNIAYALSREIGDPIKCEIFSQFMAEMLTRIGCDEYLIGQGAQGPVLVPLRMGYEKSEIDGRIFQSTQLVCFKLKRGLSLEIIKSSVSTRDLKQYLSRLPKLPVGDGKAIRNAVTRLLTYRVLEAFEPPFPKEDCNYWPQWAKYCTQNGHPILGAWLNMAVSRQTADAA